MRPDHLALPILACAASLALGAKSLASDWSTLGGSGTRAALSTEVGPGAATSAWTIPGFQSTGTPVFVERRRAFTVTRLATHGAQSMATCIDLDLGTVLWSAPVPSVTTSASAWCLGVDHGRVYATFGAEIHAFDAQTGALLWQSAQTFVSTTFVGAHLISGTTAAFAPDGDPIVDAVEGVYRLRASDGSTRWVSRRSTGEGGGHGVAVGAGAVYAAETGAGGTRLLKLDLGTGARIAASPTFAGGASGAPPFLGPDARIYLPTLISPPFPSTAPTTSTLVALHDQGAALALVYQATPQSPIEVRWHAGAPDGSLLRSVMEGPDLLVQRLDPADGSVVATSLPVASQPITSSPLVVDALGRVYLTAALPGPGGVVVALDADLSPLWSAPLASFPDGGPALGARGTLVVAGLGVVAAFRTPRTPTLVYCAGDGSAGTCPCTPGHPGNGCPNSAHASGARLGSDGIASVASDSFVLRALALPDAPCLFFQGTTQVGGGSGTVFGDGLRCSGGVVIRLGAKSAAGGVASFPEAGDPPISVRGRIPAGGAVRTYQVWHRDAAGFCSSANFGLSNGLAVTWGA